MYRDSESLIGRILNPAPMSERREEEPENEHERVTLEQIVAPEGAPAAGYTGPERRAQGYLVAEMLPEPAALDRQAPEFDPPR